MTSKVNQRVKRKNNFLDTKIEPNMKALKKDDIIAKFNALQENFDILKKKNEDLEKEKKTHIEAINLLEETVKLLEKQANVSNVDKKTEEIQTQTSDLKVYNSEVFLCGDCDYVADCMHDFNDHTHSLDSLEDQENSLFKCNFCDQTFGTLIEVMKHSKAVHSSSVPHCKEYLENVCFFGDSCWFQHSEYFRNSEPTFRCNFCDEKFRTQNAFREHMKLMHFQFVVKCTHANECKFGPRKCWFFHHENIEIAYQNAKNEGQINDNNEIDDME